MWLAYEDRQGEKELLYSQQVTRGGDFINLSQKRFNWYLNDKQHLTMNKIVNNL